MAVAPEQEATPTKSSVVRDYRIHRPNMVIRIHMVPRQRMSVPTLEEEDVPPLVPITAIDVTRRARTHLESADEKDIDDAWCGDEDDVRELSDCWVGETVFGKFHSPPPGYGIIWGRPRRLALATSGPKCGS